MNLLEIALLAIASAFWPILVAVDLVAFRTPRPATVLAWFLAAGLLTTITEGLVIVFALDGTTLASRSHRSVAAWVDLLGGGTALLAAYVLRRRPARPRSSPSRGNEVEATRRSWTERTVERGGAYAFAAGVVLNLFPGILPVVALRDIAALTYGDGVKVLLVVGLYICMFALVEAPLLGLLLAPERTEPSVERLNGWLDRNGIAAAAAALAVVGLFLLVRGFVQLLSS